jgi:hypothetical protein
MRSFGSTGWASTPLAFEVEEEGPACRARVYDPSQPAAGIRPCLVIIAVVFLISAVGQAILQALVGDNSVVVTAVLSVLGSVFLAAAIIVASRRDR